MRRDREDSVSALGERIVGKVASRAKWLAVKTNASATPDSNVSRKRLLGGLSALGAALYAPPSFAAADPAIARIDMHHHHLSPRFLSEGKAYRAFPPSSRDWTPQRSIEDMDRAGVATAMLSIPTPGVYFGDLAAARSLARACNDYGAELVRANPTRFRLFAVLPLPDVEASLREIAYVLDELGGDGVGVFSSYGKAWLGDPAFAPIFAELDRRKALLFVHPILNACCDKLVPGVPDTIVEYQTDTTRTIASLILSGTTVKYPNVRIVFSHAGGTMPYLIERFTELAKVPEVAAKLPNGVMHELQKCYYDTAWSTNPAAMAALTRVVPTTQIVFGTDYPALTAAFQTGGLATCGFDDADLARIYRGNALALVPQLGRLHARM